MRQVQYERLVGTIHRHRTWVGIVEHDAVRTFRINVDGRQRPIVSRVLVLYARQPRGVYPKGHSWSIPEYMLDRSVNAMKQHDAEFHDRWKRVAILPEDAEEIVRRASRGFLHLNLEP